jgi:hypothetical protein
MSSEQTAKSIFNFEKPILPVEQMKMLLPEAHKSYAEAIPFPHIVIDNFFDEEVLDKVLQEFPGIKDIAFNIMIPIKLNYQMRMRSISACSQGTFYTL